MSDDKVIIIGAGISGLALGQGLRKHGIQFEIYERETSPEMRLQGYRIKIFPESAEIMKYILSDSRWEDFLATNAETKMTESNINAIDTAYITKRNLGGPKPYTVDRSIFRKVLLRGIEDHIRWDKELTTYEESADAVTATFKDGTNATGALLVGAEGWNSKVRKRYIPHFKIKDSEACCVYGKTPITQELLSRISPKLLDHLSLIRDTATLIQQVVFDSELPITMFCEKMHFSDEARQKYDFIPVDYVYWSMLVASKNVGFTEEQINGWIKKPSRELGLHLTAQWDPSIRCLLECQDQDSGSSLRVITTTPDFCEWESSARVTLVGDAAHVMSTAGGVGVPTALKDAATLTGLLQKHGGISHAAAAVRDYETAMQEYARAAITRSMRGGKLFYGQPPAEQLKVFVQ